MFSYDRKWLSDGCGEWRGGWDGEIGLDGECGDHGDDTRREDACDQYPDSRECVSVPERAEDRADEPPRCPCPDEYDHGYTRADREEYRPCIGHMLVKYPRYECPDGEDRDDENFWGECEGIEQSA